MSHHDSDVDANDWEAWVSLFTEDATIEFGGFEPLEGRDELLEFAHEVVDGMYSYSRHTGQMPRIEVDGDTATGEWYLVVFYEMPDGTDGTALGTYSDRYRRVDDEWKFSHVENVVDHDTGAGEPHLADGD